MAECIASLDVIWRGNFVFGVGLGYREVEFDAFKVPKGQRLRRFEECLAGKRSAQTSSSSARTERRGPTVGYGSSAATGTAAWGSSSSVKVAGGRKRSTEE